MSKSSKQVWVLAIILALSFLLIMSLKFSKDINNKMKELELNYTALQDSLKVVVNEDSSKTARILSFETQSEKDFLRIKSQEADIIRLQELVKKYKGKLTAGSTATVISTETGVDIKNPTSIGNVDTVYRDSFIYLYPEYKSEINLDNWITGTSIANKDTTKLKLKVINDYDVVLSDTRTNIFKKYQPYAEITSHNPYTDIKTVRTYKVSAPKQKFLGVGLHAGYGVVLKPTPILAPVVSVGLNLNIFEF